MNDFALLQDVDSRNCGQFWDPQHAWISPCALPFLVIAPATVILLIALGNVFGPLLRRWHPRWTLPFISEQDELSELLLEGVKQPLHWTIFLLTSSIIAILAEVVQCFPPGIDVTGIVMVASWAMAATLIVAKRPRSCWNSLLVFCVSSLAVEIALATRPDPIPTFKVIARYVAATAAFSASCIILIMPFREIPLPIMEISAVGSVPSNEFRSPEDNLRLWQFLTVSWMKPLISIGRQRQLNESDVWLLGFEFQHRRLHEKFRRIRGSVLGRVLKANGLDVVIISAISVLQMFCDFSTPVLLQQLLQAMQDPNKPKRAALTYALLSLALRLVAAQSQVLNLWYGRRCYERSRGEMVMMIYEKALSRKNILGEKLKDDACTSTGVGSPDGDVALQEEETPRREGIWGYLMPQCTNHPKKGKEVASMGKIFNLLRGDVYEVSQRFWEVDNLIDKPLGLCIAIGLVWALFGPSCFLGIMAVFIAQAANAWVSRIALRWQRVARAATDVRLQISSQFVESIRHLRWYGWQDHWLRQVMEARKHELNLKIVTGLWGVLIRFINTFSSGVFPVIALYAYTMLAGRELRIDIIFPALQLFSMLEQRLRDIPSLITSLINAFIALERIEDFMAEPDKETIPVDKHTHTHAPSFELNSCSFAWPGKVQPVLKDIDVTIPQGLTIVTGKVGAGKTAFLQSLLGELDEIKGSSRKPNEMIGYCAQTPWLQSMSIRDNILFSSAYDERRYKRTLEACALLPDLSQFKHGDLTFIGENGIGLSGGQKARVALARAVYSTSRVLLLDDPLSALDHNTAEFLVRKCLCGPLMDNRTVVLVTHRTALVRGIANQTLEIEEGRINVHGRNALFQSSTGTESMSSFNVIDSETETDDDTHIRDEATVVPDKFIEEEHRAEWGVKARVYWNYIKAGKYRCWMALIVIISVYRLIAVGQSWFLKSWGESYSRTALSLYTFSNWASGSARDAVTVSASPVDVYFGPKDPIGKLPSPDDDVRPWLWAFLAIVSIQSAMLLAAQFLMLASVYFAGKTLFQRVMKRVSQATFRFLDVTPVGRLMNRLTSDIGVVDGNISEQFQFIAFQIVIWVSSILVIATATPVFLVFSVALTVAFVMIFLRFLPASQSLRRLEMVSLTPLLSNFGELLHGLTTVRAFRAEERFQNRVISVVDKFQGMDHFYWSLQAWLTYRFESLSAFSTFVLTALALYTNTTPGMVAFVLIAANTFVSSTHALCKQYGQLQMDFVSVERVDELLHIEEESPGTIDPPAAWPTYGGDIIFEDVTARYAPHLDPALTNVSLRIPGGSTTAIIGRTGSGKSTLAISLLSVIRPETGRILIDGIDVAQVSTQALRTRVTFVAQDPVLFSGSIRLNLDPTEEFSDGQCAGVLKRLCGRHGWKLMTHIEAGGKNLSQGQRQLIALTRAVLRRSPVVILDEATASIDHETSLEIQQIIREELQQSTVITIAHRLEAVKDAEYFIVLDQSRVSRQGDVRDL